MPDENAATATVADMTTPASDRTPAASPAVEDTEHGHASAPENATSPELSEVEARLQGFGFSQDPTDADEGEGDGDEDGEDPKPETDPEGEGEGEGEGEDPEPKTDPEGEDDGEGNLPPEAIKALQKYRKRAQKAEAQTQTLQTQLNAANEAHAAELEAVKAAKATPAATADNPLADVYDGALLNQLETGAQQILDWIDDNGRQIAQLEENETIEIPGLKNPHREDGRFDTAGLQALRANQRRYLRAIPQRRAFLANHERYHTELHRLVPELAEKGSELRVYTDRIINAYPMLKADPATEGIAYVHYLGEQLHKKLGKSALEHVRALQEAEGLKQAGKQPAAPQASSRKPAVPAPAQPRKQSVPGTGGRRAMPAARTPKRDPNQPLSDQERLRGYGM